MKTSHGPEATANSFDRLTAESSALQAKLGEMSPKASADAWVGLVREWETASSMPNQIPNSGDAAWTQVMDALPAPEAWPIIRQKLTGLHRDPPRNIVAMFDDLLGRDAAVLRYLESKRNPDADPSKEDVFSPETKISDAELPIARRANDLDLVAKIYIHKIQSSPAAFFFDGFPDLVRIFGPKRAKPVMRAMLVGAQSGFNEVNGEETRALAKSMILSDLADIKTPQWGLAEG
jgi:hypothetical protein